MNASSTSSQSREEGPRAGTNSRKRKTARRFGNNGATRERTARVLAAVASPHCCMRHVALLHHRIVEYALSRGRVSRLRFRILNCTRNRILRARFRRLLRTSSAHMRYMVTTGYSTVNLGYSRVRFGCYEGTPGVLQGAPQRHSEWRRRGRAHQRLKLCTHHFVRITHHTHHSAPAHG